MFPRVEFFLQDLRFEAGSVKELEMEWVSQEGFVENVDRVMQEYRQVRNLMPVRVLVTGPPATGKSVMSKEVGFVFSFPPYIFCTERRVPHVFPVIFGTEISAKVSLCATLRKVLHLCCSLIRI